MKLTWYGTASIVLRTAKTSVVFDPYLKDLPDGIENKSVVAQRKCVFNKQKNVFITHGHFDHLSSVPLLYADRPCRVYLTKTPYDTLKNHRFPTDKMREITVGENIKLFDVNIRVLKGKHIKFLPKDFIRGSFKKGSIRTLPRAIKLGRKFIKYPENDEIVFYEIEAEGKLIQIMGSAGIAEGVEYRTGADVLILPHQGRSDIDEYNKQIVQTLKPKRVLLDHYDNAFPPYSRDIPVDNFCVQMSKNIPTQKLVEGTTVEI